MADAQPLVCKCSRRVSFARYAIPSHERVAAGAGECAQVPAELPLEVGACVRLPCLADRLIIVAEALKCRCELYGGAPLPVPPQRAQRLDLLRRLAGCAPLRHLRALHLSAFDATRQSPLTNTRTFWWILTSL